MKLTKKQAKKYIKPTERNYEYEMAVTGIVLRTVVGAFLKVFRDEYGYGKKRLDSLKEKVDFSTGVYGERLYTLSRFVRYGGRRDRI